MPAPLRSLLLVLAVLAVACSDQPRMAPGLHLPYASPPDAAAGEDADGGLDPDAAGPDAAEWDASGTVPEVAPPPTEVAAPPPEGERGV